MINIEFSLTSQLMRIEIIDGEPWFHATDVCQILGLTNSRDVVFRLEDPMKCKLGATYNESADPWFIDEEALYTIALGCRDARKPDTVAYKFRKWVIGVIKDIRKTGSYTASEADQKHFSPFGLKINLQGAVDAHSKALEGSNASLIAETRRSLESLVKLQTTPPLTTKKDQGEKSLHKAALDRIKRLNKGNKLATPREISRHGHFQSQKIPINKIKDILDDLLAAGEVRLDESTKSYTIAPSKPS